jgi:hypothetical protein
MSINLFIFILTALIATWLILPSTQILLLKFINFLEEKLKEIDKNDNHSI